MKEIDLLILGAGWTSTFLIPLLTARSISYAATTTTGRDSTIKFKFDPSLPSQSYFSDLPTARTVLIVFPLTGSGQSKLLTTSYNDTHPKTRVSPRFIQLGSTGIFQLSTDITPTTTEDTPKHNDTHWTTRHSAYNTSNPRAVAEDELLSLSGCVLNLAGLWGGVRDPKHWVDKVASTKEKVREKKSLHMVHGEDVARAVVAVHERWTEGGFAGERWMLTDGFVYDWWALFAGWADGAGDRGEGESKGGEKQTEQCKWVYELMLEDGVRALPRSMKELGRCYDSREFWQKAGIWPIKARI